MEFRALVKSRLAALGRSQKDLARAAQVTDSYVSQLLTRRKAPPAPDRTDIYGRMEGFLRLEPGELARLADSERAEEVKRKLGRAPEPLFQRFRDLILRKCVPGKRDDVRAVFEGRPFGTLERLVAGTLLEVVQRIAREELDGENWVRLAEHVGCRSREEMRVIVLEFLDRDLFQVSDENCGSFIEPLVECWDVDLNRLRLDIVLNPSLVADPRRTFRFVECPSERHEMEHPDLAEFLEDPRLGAGVTEEELRFLRRQLPGRRKPNKLYYYRLLQVLRDPVHFHDP